MAETLLLSTTRISTYRGRQLLTAATGFFFERGQDLYLVTSRHVLHDPASGHFPDRVEFEIHLDARDLTRTAGVAVPLYLEGRAVWRQGMDSVGDVDVAALCIDRRALPLGAVFYAFGAEHLLDRLEDVEVGAQLLVVGFPLSFFDTVHRLAVARHAIVASSFGVRFQGEGYFLTDARLHRGSSGAPVVMRDDTLGGMPWRLLGIHSARMDMGGRDALNDDMLGLNSAWYADILLALTDHQPAANMAAMGPRFSGRAST
ncbi:MAG TPA: serine protease [Ramlibacter sp.]|uniref:S1 family peptidase n=1 Tax=Ramlibacter sp. TaxID=1917967 RepID=UPI002ED61967